MISSFLLPFVFFSEKRRRTFPQPFVHVTFVGQLCCCASAVWADGAAFHFVEIAMFYCRGKEKMQANPKGASSLTAAWLSLNLPLLLRRALLWQLQLK